MVGPYGKGLGVDANHMGGCMVVDPYGEVAAVTEADDIKEALLVADLKACDFAQRRAVPCFNLRTRRPEAYTAITRPTE
jgi:predicted amidohydrolase